ncbi:MAG: NPXTG-anchored protein [Clostridiaceae bacterium]|nr:NPXTG-anchored protein [Eubacteriales bacterium]
MKKLFTLVLTLAMVFAITAPAMAAWGTPGSGASGAPFTVTVTAVVPGTDGFGNTYYNPYNTNTAVVAGAPLYTMITLTVPSASKLLAQYGKANGTFTGELGLSNLYLMQVVGSTNDFMKSDGTINSNKIEPNASGTESKNYIAVVLVTAKAALPAKVTYSVNYDSALGNLTSGITVGSLSIKLDSATKATITHIATTDVLTLTLDAKSLVTQWKMTMGGSDIGIYSGQLFTKDGIVYDATSADTATYNAIKAAYTRFTNDLGFGVGDVVYFSEANIRANYGLNSSKTAYVEYTGIGTGPVITPTPTVPGVPGSGGSINVPNTGDSVSVLGYVMAGLALLAAAVVVVRKVRA